MLLVSIAVQRIDDAVAGDVHA
jgi:hypothetical protein